MKSSSALNTAEVFYPPEAAVSLAVLSRVDPTRTMGLRRQFLAEGNRRFNWLATVIHRVIVDKDVFGLLGGAENITTLQLPAAKFSLSPEDALRVVRERAFDFPRTADKVDAFMDWLEEMEQRSVLEVTHRPGAIRGVEEAWSDVFVRSAYQKGIQQSRAELRKAGYDIPKFSPDPQQDMAIAFNQPFHADRVGALYTRTFRDLQGITRAMDAQISRTLAQGLVEGRSPLQIARSLTDRVKKIGRTRARTLARTEITRAHHVANVAEAKAAGVLGVRIVAEWLTAGFDVCPICEGLASRNNGIYSIDEIEGLIPVHPNCLLDGQVKIYTPKGWKAIRDINCGDFVLTHKGRFRKVTQLHRNSRQAAAVKIELDSGRKGRISSLSLTAEHPVLLASGEWVCAEDIKPGMKVSFLATKCKRCGKLIPYYRTHCSLTCRSLDITDRQWANPEHRANISRKVKEQLKREYASGKRDGKKITEKAHAKMRELAKAGKCPLQRPDVRAIVKKVTNTPEMRRASSLRMKRNNPMRDPATVKKVKRALKAFYKQHPEKRLNARMAKHRKSGWMTWIEQRMAEVLDRLGAEYVYQYPIKRYDVDFALPALKIAIECDGEYWHKGREAYDQKRQKEIEAQGWTVLRFSGREINTALPAVEEEISRFVCNHTGEYHFLPLKVRRVKHWKTKKRIMLYNLSVQEDESYVAKGFAVHNCRCSFLPLPYEQWAREGPEVISGTYGYLPDCGEVIPGKFLLSRSNVIVLAAAKCLTATQRQRIKRAKDSHKPATVDIQRQAEANEARLAKVVKGKTSGDNKPFDVVVGTEKNPRHLIEVKTIVRGKNNKITMHPDSLRRKKVFAARFPKAKVHTVVFDDRVGKIYYREGVGSFRLSAMTEVSTVRKLDDVILRGKLPDVVDGVHGHLPMCLLESEMAVLEAKKCLTPEDIKKIKRASKKFRPVGAKDWKSPIPVDDVAKGIKDKKLKQKYLEHKADWLGFWKRDKLGKKFADSPHQVKEKVMKKLEKEGLSKSYLDLVADWQESPQYDLPLAFKLRAAELEKGVSKVAWSKKYSIEEVRDRLSGLFTDVDYIKVRAMNQAYMEAVYPRAKTFTLYRGTDGGTGRRLAEDWRKKLDKGVKMVKVEDAPVAGYSLFEETANTFGLDSEGITVRLAIPKSEVVLHKDLVSGISGAYLDEGEFCILGKVRNLDLVDDVQMYAVASEDVIDKVGYDAIKQFGEDYKKVVKRIEKRIGKIGKAGKAAEELLKVPLDLVDYEIASGENLKLVEKSAQQALKAKVQKIKKHMKEFSQKADQYAEEVIKGGLDSPKLKEIGKAEVKLMNKVTELIEEIAKEYKIEVIVGD